MLKTVTVISDTCVRCGGASGVEVVPGDTVKLWLDQSVISGFPEWVVGTVILVESQVPSAFEPREYLIEYEVDDLLGVATALRDCDILSVTCESCCDLINAWLDLLIEADEPQVTLSYKWNADGTVSLVAKAYSKIPGVTITNYEWFDPDVLSLGAGVDASHDIVGSDGTDFMGGHYHVTVTDSAGHAAIAEVWVHPTRLKFRTMDTTITTGNSTKVVALNAGETIASVIQTTAGSGILLESIAYAGLNATLTFTNTPAVASVGLQLLIQSYAS